MISLFTMPIIALATSGGEGGAIILMAIGYTLVSYLVIFFIYKLIYYSSRSYRYVTILLIDFAIISFLSIALSFVASRFYYGPEEFLVGISLGSIFSFVIFSSIKAIRSNRSEFFNKIFLHLVLITFLTISLIILYYTLLYS